MATENENIKNRKIGEENKFSVHVDLILIQPKRRSLKHGYGAVNVHVTSETTKIQSIHLLYRLKQRKEIIVKKNLRPPARVELPSDGLLSLAKVLLFIDCAMSTSRDIMWKN